MDIKLGVNFRDNSCLNVFLQELFKPAQEVAVVTLNQPRLHTVAPSMMFSLEEKGLQLTIS